MLEKDAVVLIFDTVVASLVLISQEEMRVAISNWREGDEMEYEQDLGDKEVRTVQTFK